MNEENVIFQGNGIEISEDKSNPDFLNCRFCVCDFNTNKNKVKLNRQTIEEWVSTLVGSPLVAKVIKTIKGTEDFGSHEMKIISSKDKDGKIKKKAVFDTSAFGVCTDVSVDTAEDGEDYIYANYKVWKRFENAAKIIQERCADLHTSWEVSVESFTPIMEDGKIVKVIDKGRFIGLAMLGKNIPPAYDSSGLLECASEEDDEFDTALILDIDNLESSSDIKNSTEKEENTMDVNEQVVVESTEQVDEAVNTEVSNSVEETNDSASVEIQTEETNVSEVIQAEQSEDEQSEVSTEESTEVSALTERDLRCKLSNAFEQVGSDGHRTYGWIFMMFPADNIAWFEECGRKSETELVEVKYTVENDKVTITERKPVVLTVSPREINQVVAQKDNAIIEMSAQIQSLNDAIKSLEPYKTKVEEIEKAEREAQFEQDKKELSNYAISSGYITQEELETSEEIKGYIEKLDKVSIKSLISDRIVSAALTKKDVVEVEASEAHTEVSANVQVNLNIEETNNKNSDMDAFAIIKRYIGR